MSKICTRIDSSMFPLEFNSSASSSMASLNNQFVYYKKIEFITFFLANKLV